MFKIAITPEIPDERKEPGMIRCLLEGGWDRVHLRHPGASRREMRDLIEAIPQELHSRLVLHGHFDLVSDFNLGGLHLNRRCPTPPANYRRALSRSCHTIGEVKENSGLDYVTLSPIFDSISKSGYRPAFTPAELSRLDSVTTSIVALGGITPERIDELKRYNFNGFAMLGSIPWKSDRCEMLNFIRKMSKF